MIIRAKNLQPYENISREMLKSAHRRRQEERSRCLCDDACVKARLIQLITKRNNEFRKTVIK
jgi:hypothetical protein